MGSLIAPQLEVGPAASSAEIKGAPQSSSAPPKGRGSPSPSGRGRGEGGPASRAIQRLCRLAISALARRDHSRLELTRKLLQKRLPDETPDDVAAAIDRVQSLGYLNEQRAAESFARVSSKKYGRARVQADLQRRGLDRDTIATVLPSPEDDLQTARLAWAKKFKAAPSNALERAKQARYLANKGFSSAIITSVLRASSPAPNPNATEDPDAFAFDPD